VVLVFGLSGCSSGTPSPAGAGSPADSGEFAVVLGAGFHGDGSFDPRMTCDGGGDYSPPLVFRHVPSDTTELVLSMVDDDKAGTRDGPLIHWVEWAIPANSNGLTEHVKPDSAREALSDLGEATYNGPCPPPGELHHYRFTLLALSKPLDLPYGAPARTVLEAAKPYTIRTATTVATYQSAGGVTG
jgi:Raf kinase inhibitor-like YbhB/YbcL family protein